MERAVELARRGWGRVHPNPMVGCVLVRDGIVIAEGWHAEYGGPHAEVAALQRAGDDAAGATAYISLEPCDHHDKTPPCSEALIASRVTRVVFGAVDPGAGSSGGARRLEAHGIEVVGPLFDRDRARRENPAFFHKFEFDRPYVALKLAISVDGMIASRPGSRTAITGPDAGADVHRLRAGFDGILAGSETAVVDDPLLTVRGDVLPRVAPTRIILDGRGRLTSGAALFKDIAACPVLVITTAAASADALDAVRIAGAKVRVVEQREGHVDVARALDALRDEGLMTLLCEGGGRLAAALLKADLISRFYLYQAPRSLGAAGVGLLGDDEVGTRRWARAAGELRVPKGWTLVEGPRTLGPDVMTVWDRVVAF